VKFEQFAYPVHIEQRCDSRSFVKAVCDAPSLARSFSCFSIAAGGENRSK
jgi:hypothetical protein